MDIFKISDGYCLKVVKPETDSTSKNKNAERETIIILDQSGSMGQHYSQMLLHIYNALIKAGFKDTDKVRLKCHRCYPIA